MKYFPLILKNVFRKKTRTALTIASIVLPLLVINLMGTFLRALDRPDPGATRGMFRTVTRHKVSLGNPLPVAYFEKIRQLPGVVAATKFTWFGGKYVDQSARNFFPRFAVEPETFLQVFDDAKIVAGSSEEWLSDRTGAVVGDDLVKKFGWKLGDKVVLVGDIYPVTLELTVRGIFQLPDGNATSVFFNRKYLEEARPAVAGQVGTIWVKAADGPAAERLTREIDAMFENAAAPTKTESEKAFQMGFVQMLGNVKLLINGIADDHRLRHLPDRRQHDGDGRARTGDGDRRPPDARLREAGDPRDRPRGESRPRADRRRARDPPLRRRGAGPEGGAHAVADVRIRGVVRPLSRSPRHGPRHHGLRRPRGRARPRHPVGTAADRGGAAAGGMKYLPFVLKNLFRKKTRSILTIGSILLPLFVICILGTLLRALETDPSGGKGMFRLITRHKVSIANWLLESQGTKIRQVPGVVELLRMNWFGGSYIDQSARNQFPRFSTSDPEALLRVFDEVSIAEGSAEEWVKDRTGALVGGVLMKKYGWKVGQKVPLKGDIYPITLELTIRAVYKGPDETGLYFHHPYIEETLPRVKGFVGWYWIKAASPEAAAKIPAQIDALFENSDHPTRTETEKEFQNGWVSMLGNVKLLLTSIAVIIGFVILLIAANTMAMAARERITEIAVLRTLGYPKKTILGMILGESVLLAVFGGLLGLGLFTFFYPGFRRMIQYSPMGGFAAGMGALPDPRLLAIAFLATLLIGVLAGVVPAVRASQRTITDGLRQVA